jgi:nicotinamide-nucleotide amidase
MTIFPPVLLAKAAKVLSVAIERKLTICTVESCTGGLVAACLTEVAGSSAVIDRAFVTYSNRAKTEMVGVSAELIEAHGAVSAPVARAMAEGGIRTSDAPLSVAITGIAGPGGGTIEKPVGLVHFATARTGRVQQLERRFGDIGRTEIRLASVDVALDLLLTMMD